MAFSQAINGPVDMLKDIMDRRYGESKDLVRRPIAHFHTPVTTGTSVLGLTFNGGVIIAADTLGSYGSLARFKECSRIMNVNKNIMLGVGGDYADYQYLEDVIQGKLIAEQCMDDGLHLKPAALHSWLTRVLYNRRSKMDPLWNSVVVAGMEDDVPFLGAVDKLGTAFVDKHIATGYGSYIAIPILRDALEDNPNMNQEEATSIMEKCVEILYYRDARSLNRYELGVATKEGITIIGPKTLESNWSIASKICGYE